MDAAQLQQQLMTEVAAINATFQAHNVNAGTRPQWSVIAGSAYVQYGVKLGVEPPAKVKQVASVLPEIAERISNIRQKPTPVLLQPTPLRLVVEHPAPAPLEWRKARLSWPCGVMLAGRDYNTAPPTDSVVRLDDSPHALVAGTTGSGKSTLVRMLVTSLALNNSPDALAIYLVDLKNEDLVPLAQLPHVRGIAVRPDEAVQMVRHIHDIKEARIDQGDCSNAQRVLLVVDELAQLANGAALDQLGLILSVGRTKRVHVIAATQKPTTDVMGKLSKANMTVRFVGRVTDKTEAYNASGRGETHAELLPGKGAFYRVEGADLTRLQAYWLDTAGVAQMVEAARAKWGKRRAVAEPVQPVPVYQYTEAPILAENWPKSPRTSGIPAPVPVQTVQTVLPVPPIKWPIGDRPLTSTEAEAVRMMHRDGASKNKILDTVWGGKTPKRFGWLNEALEGGAE